MILKRYTKPLYHRRCRRVKNRIEEQDMQSSMKIERLTFKVSYGAKW